MDYIRDFASKYGFRARWVAGTFEKRAPAPNSFFYVPEFESNPVDLILLLFWRKEGEVYVHIISILLNFSFDCLNLICFQWQTGGVGDE